MGDNEIMERTVKKLAIEKGELRSEQARKLFAEFFGKNLPEGNQENLENIAGSESYRPEQNQLEQIIEPRLISISAKEPSLSSQTPTPSAPFREYLAGYPINWDELRRKVYERDNYTCQDQDCKATDTKLNAHHIIFKSKGGSDSLDNLITLCESCHIKKHPHLLRRITLANLLDFYKQQGVVGEERALLQLTWKVLTCSSVNVGGPAGRGKTKIINTIVSLLPKEDVYILEFASDSAIFNNSQEINKAKILVVPEYQKLLDENKFPQTKEAIKTIIEGRVVEKIKTESSGEVKKYTLNPKCLITALATENHAMRELIKDKETLRRISTVLVDTSVEHAEEVQKYKLEARCTLPEKMQRMSSAKEAILKQHVADCLNLKVDHYFDPFALYMDQHLPLTPKSMAYVDHYFAYLNGCAKFNYKARSFEYGQKKLVILSLQDHYIVHSVYHKEYCNSLLTLDNLTEFGAGKKRSDEPVDWKECFESGLAKMRESFPDWLVDKWKSAQLTNNKLTVTDPITREEKLLVDYSSGAGSAGGGGGNV